MKQIPALFFLALTIFSFACQSKSEQLKKKLQSDLKTYFIANLEDSTLTVDSFRVIKIDTITQQMLIQEQSKLLTGQLNSLVNLYTLKATDISISVDKMKLYAVLGSSELIDIERREYKEKLAKSQLLESEMDTVMAIVASLDSSAKFADTAAAIGFQAKCFYQLRKPDKSVERDTTFIILNTNMDIIKRSEFTKLPYEVDFDKF